MMANSQIIRTFAREINEALKELTSSISACGGIGRRARLRI